MAGLTTAALSARPEAGEVPEYYRRYVGLVPDGDILERLRSQLEETTSMLDGLSEEQAGHRYAPGKWSIREVIGHVADTERVFAYRLLRFARGDSTALAGFDETQYTPAGRFDDRALPDLLDELRTVRAGTVALIGGLPDGALARGGTASGVDLTGRAIVWIIAGHELHHRGLLRERYLPVR